MSIVVVDADGHRSDDARRDGHLAVTGNGADPRTLREAHADSAGFAIVALPTALEAGAVAACLRAQAPGLSIIARAHTDEDVGHLLRNGADAAVIAETELAHSIVAMIEATPARRGDRPLPPAPVTGIAG